MHQFIDPDLKRVQTTWDDVEVPARLREIAEETWRGLSKLAEPGGDTPDVHALLDEVRESYVAFYDEAEAVAQSSVIARPARGPAAGAGGAAAGRADAVRGPRRERRIRRASGQVSEPDPADFPIRWAWEDGPLTPGLTCVFRVKNEARNLPWVLPPMFDAVQHVVLVDNGSDDGTAEVAQRVAEEHGAADRFTLASYPFQVARAGAEHLHTPPDSVHSLTYFYNWSFAHVRTSYSMKWDGDMVLTAEGVELLRDLSWQLEDSNAVVAIPRHPMSVESESVAWLDLGYRFLEPWVYPMGPEFTFVKAFEWEVREFPPTSERIVAPEGMCVELKWLDQDEFAHWSDTDFDAVRTPRKARELEVNRALHEGRGHEIEGLKRIEAPAGVHVVDYVTKQWMQLEPRPLTLRLELQETSADGPRSRARRLPPGGARRSQVVIGPDGEVEPGKYDRVAVTVRDRGELRALRVPKGVRTAALAVWLDEGTSALSLTPRPEWPALQLIRSRAVDGGWLTVLRFARRSRCTAWSPSSAGRRSGPTTPASAAWCCRGGDRQGGRRPGRR